MNRTPRHKLLCGLALIALTLAAFPARAQITSYNGTTYYPTNTEASYTVSGYLNVRVPVARLGHSFAVNYKVNGVDATPRTLSIQGLAGNGYGPTSTVSCVAMYASPPVYPLSSLVLSEYWVTDTTTHHESVHVTPSGGDPLIFPSVIDVRDTTWLWPAGLGAEPTLKSFALPVNDHWGHSLVAGYPGSTWVTVTAGQKIGTYQNGNSGSMVQFFAPWFLATASPTSTSFYIADLSNDLRTPTGALDARTPPVTWFYDAQYAAYPFRTATVTLNNYEAGHKYTVHCQVGSAPEMQTPVTAALNSGGASASLAISVPSGVPFWITRDAEKFVSPHPVAPTSGTWTATTNGTTFNASSIFPRFHPPDGPPPTPLLDPYELTVNATPATLSNGLPVRAGHTFSVRMENGYITTIGSTAHHDDATNLDIPAYTESYLPNYDDHGVAHPLPVYLFNVKIDNHFTATLYDDNTGEALLTFVPPGRNIELLDGWVAQHTTAPQYPTITLELPTSRIGHAFTLSYNGPFTPQDFAAPGAQGAPEPIIHLQTDIEPVDVRMASYSVEYFAFSFDNPAPYVNAFSLSDHLFAPAECPASLSANGTNLRTWFTPPANLDLQISSSRWDHPLVILHPNGEAFSIQKHYLGTETTLQANHHPWQQSYFYFEAGSQARYEMPWYVKDTLMNELAGPFHIGDANINEELNNWFSTPAPAELTATEDNAGHVNLQWPLSFASRDGAYSVEMNTGDGWVVVEDNFTSDHANAATNLVPFQHQPAGFPAQIQYRVRFRYGDQFSAYSPVANFIWHDDDQDGLPDAWERVWGLAPNNIADASAWLIGDGRTAQQLYASGADFNSMNFANTGGAPQFDPHTRLYLHWAVMDDGITPCLVWDAPSGATGSVTIQYEDADNNDQWVVEQTVDVTDGRYQPQTRPPRDYARAVSGQGPAVNEPYNYRLRGEFTSNETAVKVRLMMKTSQIVATQPGKRDFVVPGTTPASPARRYYKRAELEEYHSTNDDLGGGDSNWYWRNDFTTVTVDPAARIEEWWSDGYAGGGSTGHTALGTYGFSYSSNGNDNWTETTPFASDYGYSFGRDYRLDSSSWSSTDGESSTVNEKGCFGSVTTQYRHFIETGPPRLEHAMYDPLEETSTYFWYEDGQSGMDTHSIAVPVGVSWEEGYASDPTHSEYTGEGGNYHYSLVLSEEYSLADFQADSRAKLPEFLGTRGDVTGSSQGFDTTQVFDRFPWREEGNDLPIEASPSPIITSRCGGSRGCSRGVRGGRLGSEV